MARIHIATRLAGVVVSTLLLFGLTISADAAINLGTTDASDGAFNPTAGIQIDLGQAVTGTWDQDNSANAGKGVYDPAKWAVVFKYSSINIPAGVAITFKNHPSGCPVVWLVQGDALIAGSVNLNGSAGALSGGYAEPGPGGFRGGAGGNANTAASGGFGPGGGSQIGGNPSSSYGTYSVKIGGGASGEVYGNPQVLPILGGSGGAGALTSGQGGGAGGGAFLLGVGGMMTLNGTITATGGTSGYTFGSGGGVRVIADIIKANSGTKIDASGSVGNVGRIRLEANSFQSSVGCSPPASTYTLLGAPAVIWPPSNLPSVSISHIAGIAAPADPHAILAAPDHYATISSVQPIVVRLNAANVPTNWNVVLRVVPFSGLDMNVAATFVSGDATSSVWEASFTAPFGVSSLQAKASKP